MVAGLALSASGCTLPISDPEHQVRPAQLTKVAETDPRFQSYNIEMVQVTGGRFWAPYGGPAGETHRYHPPVDLADPRLRALAAQLSPAYLRVSGTWANTTYVAKPDELISTPPTGFGQVLTAAQWQGVVRFAKAVDARIVTSFAASAGTREPDGTWTSEHASRLLDLTKGAGGTIYAAEFVNEPSLVRPGGLPLDYNRAAFGRDFTIFAQWAKQNAPDMLILGPGNLGEKTVDPGVASSLMAPGGAMASALLLEETAGKVDAVSWHFYGGVSPRCRGGTGLSGRDAALSAEWLDRTLVEHDAMARLRDDLAPGKPLWLTETAQAACGGSPWAAGFRDSFRYVNQLGLLAQRGAKVVMHNTLAASDYGLIDQQTLEPRANYWAALLWRRTMGAVVLSAPKGHQQGLRIFAHCLPEMNGGVGLAVLNTGAAVEHVSLGKAGELWLIEANDLDRGRVTVNAAQPSVAQDGTVIGLSGESFTGGFSIPGQSIIFAALKKAANPNCRHETRRR